MDNEEAKFLLRAYRPNGADAGDPMFTEALAQAQRDPALAKWLEQELALDRAVAQKLRAVAAPAGLRESILAGGKVSHFSRPWWQQGSWIALAACLAVFASAAFLWPKFRARTEVYRMAEYAMSDTLHGQHGNHGQATDRLCTFLESGSTHLAGAPMPVSFEELRATGCRTLSFAGHDVAEICFARAGKEYHLYVMSKLGPQTPAPKIRQDGPAAAAAWTDAHQTYVVATAAGVSALSDVL